MPDRQQQIVRAVGDVAATEPGAPITYTAVVAGAGASVWAASLETWLGITVMVLTIMVLLVRLWVDIPRALRKRKEK
tara:strand:- start:7320 stop:7550 length:231 start_codon:yes stop_codon:yes gene_type:complete